MDNIYLLMIIALAVLAIADLVVGVSNDAVNFLNSAVGSKAVSIKTIMIVASIGIALGAIFSSGMMEVARKGIFNPDMFMFADIMVIFMAVMITDILLLDFFNTIGMPTSTTVSIVFELLGAAVAIALVKIYADGGGFSEVVNYINTSQATEIITGILLSVIISFTVGAIVQYIARLLLSFNYDKKAAWVGALFGGIALTSMVYFILLKGIGGTGIAKASFAITEGKTIKEFLEIHAVPIIAINLAFWSVLSFVVIKFLKVNIYKIVIIVGTFALALAFAGNDLVNFIGVPIAAWQSYQAWVVSGVPAAEFGMSFLADKVPTPTLLLFISGIVMVLTLWFSKKAKYVAQTEINLSREGSSKERFEPNFLSRILVRSSKAISFYFEAKTPKSIQYKIEKQFEKPVIQLEHAKNADLPAFDLVRAAVNLMVAGILISIATSYKLPLSTTYVTFMVAMGSSLSDRAWGSESAVYRVAGVMNVIGGWFFTAIIAFVAAATVAYLIHIGGAIMIGFLLLFAILIIIRNSLSYLKKSKEVKAEDSLNNAESDSVQGVIEETANNISKVLKRVDKIQSAAIEGLVKEDLKKLKKAKNDVGKLETEIEDLQNNIFYFIKNLHESSVSASAFYIDVIKNLQDIAQSIGFISKISYKHIHNNHKALKENQANELKEIELKLNEMFSKTRTVFESNSLNQIPYLIEELENLLAEVGEYTQKQVERTRTTESSPKNTTLYFSILLEFEDLLKAKINLLELYTKV
ncbi:inorganic phosphate transporter [Lutibacter sp.]|jgi:phosphate/sulfate permease|uniref:inorganic phosphate transporter n=1 Tax=Lutibacter sp. TaxID=1925666 RepID=UPI001A21F73C|nr:inorganic phosphate transporter [Lutibacter sp.]MBI9041068.1 inorganic phosphate transporter [Lutibacter sp.]